jgi:sec-independent protein translocase protein TatA
MTAMIFNLGPTELIIILVIVLVLFGGARLAGLGKSTGRAIKEFKEETKGLGGDKDKDPEVVDAEVVDPQTRQQPTTPPAVNGRPEPTVRPTSQDVPQAYETRRDS